MSAISATRRQAKEMADGTIRVSIDIDPMYKAQFHAMFPDIDMPVAIAPLIANFESAGQQTPQNQPEIAQESNKDGASAVANEKPKGGELAKWAGILCADPEFWKWFACDEPIGSPEKAAEAIRFYCEIGSRADLDHNPVSAKIFREQIMAPFHAWKENRV